MRPALIGVSAALFAVGAILEGAITLAVVRAVERMNPGCLAKPESSWNPGGAFFGVGALALVLGGILIASPAPDALERFLGQMGTASETQDWLRKASAGVAGLAIVFGVCFGLGRVLLRRRNA
jgi:hypothetical protein